MRKTIKMMGRSKNFVDENFLHFFVRFLLPPKCQVLISTLTVLHVCTFSCIGDDGNEGEFHKSFCSDKIPVLENVSVSIQ